jgi:hypothetical protein
VATVSVAVSGAPPQEHEQVKKIVDCVEKFERGMGKDFRRRSLDFYHQYRGFRRYSEAYERAEPRDRDEILYDAKKHWGAHLHIPLSFRTIETMVPRALAQMPKLLVTPRDEQFQENVQTVRMLLDAQQEQIDIDLPFQAVMRAGQIYGLGVGKAYWKNETQKRRVATPRTKGGGFYLGEMKDYTTFDDPFFEDVDIFDFMWDMLASDVSTASWTCHRVWLSTQSVLHRLESEAWDTDTARLLRANPPEAEGMRNSNYRFDEIWAERMQASGFGSFVGEHGETPHEVLEYHNGSQVLTVLDRTALVQDDENPCGEMPFQVYRPIPVGKQMVGIGALEPMQHLQREMDTLRSQRRDAATVALNKGFVYNADAIKPEHLTFGPAMAIPVYDGMPVEEALKQLQVNDVPGSSYQDEASIRGDMESVSGEQDALNNNPATEVTTATQAQLVQAAQSHRIALTSRRFEIEVVRPVARCWLHMDQRMILTPRPPIRQPEDGMSVEQAYESGRWKWYPLGPEQLQGEFQIVAEGGSMVARNIPQDRNDASQLMSLFGGDFYVDPTKMRVRALRLMGIEHPESYLRNPEPSVPKIVLKFLEEAGKIDPNMIEVAEIRAREVSAPEEGVNAAGGEPAPAQVGAPQ